MYILGYPLQAFGHILGAVLFLYTIIIMASVVISWLRLDPWHPVVRILNQLTAPIYKKIRRFVPHVGGLDLAPLVALLGIMFLEESLLKIIMRLAKNLIGAQG